MTLKELASEIAKREKKLKEVSIGNIREIIGIISDMIFTEFEGDQKIANLLYDNGAKRAKKKPKAKKK